MKKGINFYIYVRFRIMYVFILHKTELQPTTGVGKMERSAHGSDIRSNRRCEIHARSYASELTS